MGYSVTTVVIRSITLQMLMAIQALLMPVVVLEPEREIL